MNKLIVVAGGAGKLGRLIVNVLREAPGVTVRALVRDPDRPELAPLRSAGVVLHRFDASTATDADRAAAVAGAWAVVSALQGGPDVIVDAQLALLRAAKAAGARRFLPSDYSYDLFSLPEGVNVNSDWRRALAARAAAEVTPTFEVVHVLQGIFIDGAVLGFLGMFDAERGVLRYWGDGETPIDWTTWEDTARYVAAAALDDAPVPERLFVRGDRASALQFAEIWQRVHGRPLTVERLGSLQDLEQETHRRLAASPQDMYAWLPLMYARGMYGGQALLGALHNARYPHIVPETLAAALARGAA